MSLRSLIKWMIFDFDHLYDMSVRGSSRDHHALCRQFFTKCVVDLIAMSVTFLDLFLSKQLQCFGIICKNTGITSKS